MSKNVFRSSNSTFHVMNFGEKIFWFGLNAIFYKFLKTFKSAASLPWFEVSLDIGSGTRDLDQDLSDLKTSGNFASELRTFSWKCWKGALPLFVTTLMIQKTTSVFVVGSWTYVTGISLMAIFSTLFLWSAAGVDRKKIEFWTLQRFVKKLRFIPVEKFFRRSSLGEM